MNDEFVDGMFEELEEAVDKLINANDKLLAENRELKQEIEILVNTIRDLELKLQGTVH